MFLIVPTDPFFRKMNLSFSGLGDLNLLTEWVAVIRLKIENQKNTSESRLSSVGSRPTEDSQIKHRGKDRAGWIATLGAA